MVKKACVCLLISIFASSWGFVYQPTVADALLIKKVHTTLEDLHTTNPTKFTTVSQKIDILLAVMTHPQIVYILGATDTFIDYLDPPVVSGLACGAYKHGERWECDCNDCRCENGVEMSTDAVCNYDPPDNLCTIGAIDHFESKGLHQIHTTLDEDITFTEDDYIYLPDEGIVAYIEFHYAPCPEDVMCNWSGIGYNYTWYQDCTHHQKGAVDAVIFGSWTDEYEPVRWKRHTGDHQTTETGKFYRFEQ